MGTRVGLEKDKATEKERKSERERERDSFATASTFVLPFEIDGRRRSGSVPPLLPLVLSIVEVKDAPADGGAAQLETREQLQALMTARLRPAPDERVYDGNGHVRRQRRVLHVLRPAEENGR